MKDCKDEASTRVEYENKIDNATKAISVLKIEMMKNAVDLLSD